METGREIRSDLCNGQASDFADLARVGQKKPRETQSLTGGVRDVMRAAGFEPTTSCSGGKRSIQLSYARRTLARLGVAGTAPESLSLTPGCDRHKEPAPDS